MPQISSVHPLLTLTTYFSLGNVVETLLQEFYFSCGGSLIHAKLHLQPGVVQPKHRLYPAPIINQGASWLNLMYGTALVLSVALEAGCASRTFAGLFTALHTACGFSDLEGLFLGWG